MKLSEHNYRGYSHAQYIENDPVQYELKASEIIYNENQPPHFHDDVELFYVVEGQGILYVNNESNKLSPGCLVMLTPSHVHSIQLISKNLSLYQCHVSLGLILFSSISRTVEKYISYSLAYGNVVVKLPAQEQNDMITNFKDMIKEVHNDSPLNKMIALNIASKIILIFGRNIVTDIINDENPDHSMTWKLMQYIYLNFDKNITAKSLAVEFSLTPINVNNYFYQLTGENLSEHLHRTRIRYACGMLQYEQLSSNYIGKYVGYKNTASFYKKFKELKNMTPDEYRKSHVPPDHSFKSLNSSWRILLYIFDHYAEPLDETTISRALFITPDKIHTELLSNFDISLPDLVTKIRLQYARSFLQVLDEPILKIAYLSGFASVRTFNRSFKEYIGYTPIEYRNIYRNNNDVSY